MEWWCGGKKWGERHHGIGTCVQSMCKLKAGLTIHRRRMHEVLEQKKVFKCEACQEEFGQEANLMNHRKVCGGG